MMAAPPPSCRLVHVLAQIFYVFTRLALRGRHGVIGMKDLLYVRAGELAHSISVNDASLERAKGFIRVVIPAAPCWYGAPSTRMDNPLFRAIEPFCLVHRAVIFLYIARAPTDYAWRRLPLIGRELP
jgi:hypothetical protein